LFLSILNLCSSLSVRDSFTHTKWQEKLYFLYFNLKVFREETGRQKILNWIEQAFLKFYVLSFFINTVLICYYHSKIFHLCTFLKDLLAIIELLFCPASWWQDITMYLVSSVYLQTNFKQDSVFPLSYLHFHSIQLCA
jgi:hypothetical protein